MNNLCNWQRLKALLFGEEKLRIRDRGKKKLSLDSPSLSTSSAHQLDDIIYVISLAALPSPYQDITLVLSIPSHPLCNLKLTCFLSLPTLTKIH